MPAIDLIPLRPAPPDPVMLGARGERPLNYNSAVGRWLMHQSHMPLGIHAGKIMQRVPAAYLLETARQPWCRGKDWFPVLSYVRRHRSEIEDRARTEIPTAPLSASDPVDGLPHIRRHDAERRLTCACGGACRVDITGGWQKWLARHADHREAIPPDNRYD